MAVDIRNYINPGPAGRFTLEWQAALMPDGESYIEDRSGNIFAAWVKSLGKDDIARVRRTFLLAPWTGTPRERRKAIANRLEAIKDVGGVLLEAETQRRSDVRGQASEMLMDAYQDIATGGRAFSGTRMGRPSTSLDAKQLDAARQIWFSRRYTTRKQAADAIQALGIMVSRGWLYNKFGLPNQAAAAPEEAITYVPDPMKKLRRNGKDRVYFIQDGEAVKIGHSIDPPSVLKSLARGNHRKLVVLGTLTGGAERESALHKQFAQFRIKNGGSGREWFYLVPPIKEYIGRWCKPKDRGPERRKRKAQA